MNPAAKSNHGEIACSRTGHIITSPVKLAERGRATGPRESEAVKEMGKRRFEIVSRGWCIKFVRRQYQQLRTLIVTSIWYCVLENALAKCNNNPD